MALNGGELFFDEEEVEMIYFFISFRKRVKWCLNNVRIKGEII